MACRMVDYPMTIQSLNCGLLNAHTSLVASIWKAGVRRIHFLIVQHLADTTSPGAPFHAEGKPPRAPCPFCVAKKNDQTPRNLYGIRTASEGGYDAAIPPAFFAVPPVRLDADTKEASALRVSLVCSSV